MEVRAFSPILKKLIPVLLTIIIVAGLYEFYGAWAYTIKNLAEFFRLTWEHLLLVIISMAAAVTVGVGLGTLMTRKGFDRLSPAIMGVVNVWQSVPSLGVIALAYGFLPLLGLSGIGAVPALIALFFHAVAPIVRNTYAGIQTVSKDVIEAATGMGMNPKQILFRIELPIALPVIMGGSGPPQLLLWELPLWPFLSAAAVLGFGFLPELP